MSKNKKAKATETKTAEPSGSDANNELGAVLYEKAAKEQTARKAAAAAETQPEPEAKPEAKAKPASKPRKAEPKPSAPEGEPVKAAPKPKGPAKAETKDEVVGTFVEDLVTKGAEPALKALFDKAGKKVTEGFEPPDAADIVIEGLKPKAPKVKAKPEAKPEVKAKPEAKAAPKAKPEAPETPAANDFLMFIGDAHYDKAGFIEEANTQGISKRLPSWRVPADLQVAESRIWLAVGGGRKAGESTVAEVFGYFIPDAMEFIAGPEGKEQFKEIIAGLKEVKGSRIVWSIKGEKKRRCGYRKVGGTYLTSKSPVVETTPQPYQGNHFRGVMRLGTERSQALRDGKGLTTLLEEKCMGCSEPMLAAPDGHNRAERERRRMEKGEEPKWKLLCAECAKEARAEKRAAKAAAAAEGEPEGDSDGEHAVA